MCRCWAHVVYNLEHLWRFDVYCYDSERLLPRLRSLGEWLVRRVAPRLRELNLDVSGCSNIDEHLQTDATAILAAVVAVCGAAGQLSSLHLQVGWPLSVSSWLVPLGGSLQSMSINGSPTVRVSSSLAALTALQELSLGNGCNQLVFDAAARLLVSLTRLELGESESGAALPEQVSVFGLGARVYTSLQQQRWCAARTCSHFRIVAACRRLAPSATCGS